jgi:hypothetical protein
VTREDVMVAAAGVALAIGLIAFPWLSPGGAATSGIGGFWALVALLLLVVVLIDLALARLSPATIVPTTALGREMTRALGVGGVVLMLLFKATAETKHYGWGFYVDLLALIVVVAGAWGSAQGRATPLRVGRRRRR